MNIKCKDFYDLLNYLLKWGFGHIFVQSTHFPPRKYYNWFNIIDEQKPCDSALSSGLYILYIFIFDCPISKVISPTEYLMRFFYNHVFLQQIPQVFQRIFFKCTKKVGWRPIKYSPSQAMFRLWAKNYSDVAQVTKIMRFFYRKDMITARQKWLPRHDDFEFASRMDANSWAHWDVIFTKVDLSRSGKAPSIMLDVLNAR